jgi:hypothetical protein
MSRIVVCGDSFNSYDERYVGLHWADQLAPHEVYRLARSGASNFSIWHQVVQSKKFNPDVVLVAFTSVPRIEYSLLEPDFFNDLIAPWLRLLPGSPWGGLKNIKNIEKPVADLRELEKQLTDKVIKSIDHAIPNGHTEDLFNEWARRFYIEPFEILKNYLYIKATLDLLKQNGITAYATLGAYKDFVGTIIQDVQIGFDEYANVLQLPNGWEHPNCKEDPLFHIKDPVYHKNHADIVLKLLERTV